MFNKLKHLKNLRSQAKQIQNTLSQESVTVSKNGINLTMNGNLEITSLAIEENSLKSGVEKKITECVNEAVKKAQKIMAQKMQEMGGLKDLGL